MPSPSNPDGGFVKPLKLPPGAKDVTAKFANVLPGVPLMGPEAMVNLNTLVAAQDAMVGAVNNTYLGNFHESDAKGNVSRTVQVTGWQDIMMNEIVQDSRFGYSGTKAQFIRHAIELLITYYQEQGMVPEERQGMFGDFLRAARMMREDAEREKIRADFTDSIRTHDRAMDTARLTADWAHVASRLRAYMDAIESCESEAQRRILRGVFAESVATRTAVSEFSRWLNDSGRPDKAFVEGWQDTWPDLGQMWQDWYNSDWTHGV